MRTWTDYINNFPGKPWYDAAPQLAEWTSRRLANRDDVYRVYKTFDYRYPDRLWTFTGPWLEESRDYGSLTAEVIAEHYRGDQEKLICLHAISVENTSRWFAIDVDQHGNDGPVQAEENLKAALGWYEDLFYLGFKPLLMDANGLGGYHLLVCLAEPVPAVVVHDFVHELVQNYADHGLRLPPDVFPAEPEVNPHRPYGSYWRLPGHHHTRDYWTRVWDGSRWLEDEEAIEMILATTGDPTSLIPGYLGVPEGSPRLHDGGFVRLAEFLLKEGFEPLAVEELAVRWDATQFQPARNEELLRQIIRDLVNEA